jgi:hypothetical protein
VLHREDRDAGILLEVELPLHASGAVSAYRAESERSAVSGQPDKGKLAESRRR